MTDTIKRTAVLFSILVIGVPVSVCAAIVGQKEYTYHREIREQNHGRDLGNKVAVDWLTTHDAKLYKDEQEAAKACFEWSGVKEVWMRNPDGTKSFTPHYSGYYWAVNKAAGK